MPKNEATRRMKDSPECHGLACPRHPSFEIAKLICAAMDCRVKPGNDESGVVYSPCELLNENGMKGEWASDTKMPGSRPGILFL